jgi:transposase InsO family protein
VQYLSIRYTERLGHAGVVTSVGLRGDRYDNALTESFNGLDKNRDHPSTAPWRDVDDVEFATPEMRRLIQRPPATQDRHDQPAELEASYHCHTRTPETREPQPL